MKYIFYKIKLSAFVVFAFLSCKIRHSLPPNQYRLESYAFEMRKNKNIHEDELHLYVRQKPNKKTFKFIPFYTWWYYRFNDSVIHAKKKKRDSIYDLKNIEISKRYEEINKRRAEKGKPPKQPKYYDKNTLTFLENIRSIGEPFVIHDSEQTRQSAQNLQKFLFQKGYFQGHVEYDVKYKKKKAYVKYKIMPGEGYFVDKISYHSEDKTVLNLILSDTAQRKIKTGDLCDFNKISNERNHITNLLKNNGYYDFDAAFIDVEIDTLIHRHRVQVYFHVHAPKDKSKPDTTLLLPHPLYRISNIYVITESIEGNYKTTYFPDTLYTKDKQFAFLVKQKLLFNPEKIGEFIYIHKNSLYKQDSAEATFRALNRMGAFSRVQVYLNKSEEEKGKIICYIVCQPKVKQNISASLEGINTSGNLGTDFSIAYKNINVFRGGEQLHFKVHSSLSAQREFSENKESLPGYDFYQTFNTILIGPELKFSVPRAFFPFSLLGIKRDMSPSTFLKSSLQYQLRSEFFREIISGDYGFNFTSRDNKFRYEITPVEVLVVKSIMTTQFKNDLYAQNDAFLINSFINHINLLGRFSLVYQTAFNRGLLKNIRQYVRFSFESAGNIPRLILERFPHAQKDSLNRYTIANIPFAQFLRTQLEFRTHIPVHKKSFLVYRAMGGIGVPLKNLSTLPYENSFFAGGPNSIRAWRARLLGPGGYDGRQSSARFDRIGDLILEGNAEFRFPFYKSFHGALFADAGNIWRLRKDPDKPGGEFNPENFFNQIALGAGFGIRWDLEFLILRLDTAMPVKDPSYPEGQRFTFDKKPYRNLVFNFGIGYPF
ncbi:MAG: outer membrane protein assembly factor [Bacteroidia bacterium]|nr:outer membrane protein assembly factor [Bacteroidia bacterium]